MEETTQGVFETQDKGVESGEPSTTNAAQSNQAPKEPPQGKTPCNGPNCTHWLGLAKQVALLLFLVTASMAALKTTFQK